VLAIISAAVKLIRVRQWVKNLFVFAPLVFSLRLFDPDSVLAAVTAFFAFSFTASSLYALNDIVDLERDRFHPKKKYRPLPAGLLTVPQAALVGGLCFGLGLTLALELGLNVMIILGVYVLSNLYYSFFAKHVIILDTMLIALGFVLRVMAGAYALPVVPSSWMLVATFFLSLLLGLGKRYNELSVMREESASHREVLEQYDFSLIKQMFAVASSSTVVAYALYTMDPKVIRFFQTENLVFTLPFVVFGVFRYIFLVLSRQEGGEPAELVFKDRTMLITVVLWVMAVIVLIY